MASRRRRAVFSAGTAAGLTVAGLALPQAGNGQTGPLPPAHIRTLVPRVVSLTPRIIDLRPKQSARGRSTTFTVQTDVLFAFGSASLSLDAQAVLGGVLHRLRKAPAGTVTVVGYTDSIGSASYNLNLSLRRARAVQTYLAAHAANPRLHYRSLGKGMADPVAPNTRPDGADNPDGRRENRRVEITSSP